MYARRSSSSTPCRRNRRPFALGRRCAQRATRLALVALALSAANPAQADGPDVYVGRWSFHQTKKGIAADGGGPFKLRVFPEGGRFTCIMHGNVTLQGQMNKGGVALETKGTVALAAPMCAGTFDAVDGSISGKATIHSKSDVTMTAKELKTGKEQRKHVGDARDEPVDLKGQRSGDTFTGTIVDDDGMPMRFHATREGGGEAEQPQDPPPAAEPPAAEPPAAEPPAAEPPAAEPPAAEPPAAEPPAAEPPAAEPSSEEGDLRDALKKAKTDKERDAAIDKHLHAKEEQARKSIEALEKQLQGAGDTPGSGNDTTISDELDAAANKLGSDAKDAVSGKIEQAVLDKADAVFDKAWSKVSKTESKLKPSSVKGGLDKLQSAKETLESARKVYDRVKEIDEKVKSGKLSSAGGKLLKVGAFMGKALSTMVGWLPMPGLSDAGSEVTEKTFEAAMKVGEVLGENATTLDCCYDDPAADCCQ